MKNTQEDWLGLKGAVVAVTGATGAIGATIARSFAEAGAHVAILDLDIDECHSLAKEISATGPQAIGVACDVSDVDSVQNAARQVEQSLGTTRVLINNAAILNSGSVIDIAPDMWDLVLKVNLTGYMLCAQAFGQQMARGSGGAMVHTASISGHTPQPYSGAYSVAKAGVRMLSQVLAVELGSHSIRSNVVSPAMVVTPLSEAFYADPQLRKRREEIVPLNRIGAPEDIAQAAVWLSSPRASYISGEEIVVDGAWGKSLLAQVPRPGYDRADVESN